MLPGALGRGPDEPVCTRQGGPWTEKPQGCPRCWELGNTNSQRRMKRLHLLSEPMARNWNRYHASPATAATTRWIIIQVGKGMGEWAPAPPIIPILTRAELRVSESNGLCCPSFKWERAHCLSSPSRNATTRPHCHCTRAAFEIWTQGSSNVSA